jgi:histone H3/H4
MDPRVQDYAPGANSYRQCLNISVATLLTEIGFDKVEPMALETLGEMTQSFLHELGRSGKAYCELACRVEPLGADVLLALSEMGQGGPNGCNPTALLNYARRPNKKTLGQPQTAVQPKQTSMLHTGDRRKDGRGKASTAIIPDYLTEFPDAHSYIRTPTHRQPEADYETVREKAASQKRDVERALTRFVAKTCGKTHSLFNHDDTNLFPLISCDPAATRGTVAYSSMAAMTTGPNMLQLGAGQEIMSANELPPLPSYLSGILFRDQLFEEDEREYLPKKKKGEYDDDDMDTEEAQIGEQAENDELIEDNEPNKDSDQEADPDRRNMSDEKEATEQKEKSRNKKEDEDKKESGTINNPYLRPVRMPRNAIVGATVPSRRVQTML